MRYFDIIPVQWKHLFSSILLNTSVTILNFRFLVPYQLYQHRNHGENPSMLWAYVTSKLYVTSCGSIISPNKQNVEVSVKSYSSNKTQYIYFNIYSGHLGRNSEQQWNWLTSSVDAFKTVHMMMTGFSLALPGFATKLCSLVFLAICLLQPYVLPCKVSCRHQSGYCWISSLNCQP